MFTSYMTMQVVDIEEHGEENQKVLAAAIESTETMIDKLMTKRKSILDHHEFSLKHIEDTRQKIIELLDKALESHTRKLEEQMEKGLQVVDEKIADVSKKLKQLNKMGTRNAKLRSLDVKSVESIHENVITMGSVVVQGLRYINLRLANGNSLRQTVCRLSGELTQYELKE